MKPGFYFVKIDKNGSKTLSYLPGEDYCWPELLPEFKDFLSGCGYILPENSTLEIVEEETPNEL